VKWRWYLSQVESIWVGNHGYGATYAAPIRPWYQTD